ncbi:MBG domain-containing protein [Blautia sp. MSJ-9]|uniref:MBG domain-containing protein n=1 Tax=Blautia sp. MSJ-9 TaxID=2841511 RepID=UPI001C123D34|nr:MBG domain-containing protein [Blautia sp. MSJ-9]MBU5680711.1 Ig-like domain-containing protein [Blautia sp. MSJ-9]
MTKEQLRKNWRRGFAVALTAAMVANSTLPSAAFAAEFTSPDVEEEISLQDNTQAGSEESVFDDGSQNAESAENAVEDFSSGDEVSVPAKEVQEGDFNQTKTVDGIEVSVTADKGVFPEGASLNVRKVKKQSVIDAFEDVVQKQQETSSEDAMVEEIREELKKMADQGVDDFGVGTEEENDLQVFDITITDENGEEIQPDNSKGSATVSFSGIDTDNSTEDIQIYHADDDLENVQALDTEAYVEAGYAEVPAEHFSYYCLSTFNPGTQFEIHELTSAYANTELTTGIYYVSENTPEFVGADSKSSSQAGGNGLKIANGATVYIYIADGKTLTAAGGQGYAGTDGKNGTSAKANISKITKDGITYNHIADGAYEKGTGGAGGSGATGGGAAIYVPEGSKIAILGNGSLNVTGGTGGNAGNGQNGQKTIYSKLSFVSVTKGSSISLCSTTNNVGLNPSCSGTTTIAYKWLDENLVIGGAGGSGGGGAAGGGAGIGTNGANGNVGANGVIGNADQDEANYVDKVAGKSATANISASSSGQIYIGNVTVNATGGQGGQAGSRQSVVAKHNHSITYYKKKDTTAYSGTFWVQDGQSGGGGGAGGTGASIGTGGVGGAGGSGGDSGSCWTKDDYSNKTGYAPESVRGNNGGTGTNGSGSKSDISDSQNPYNTVTFTGASSNVTQNYYLAKESVITVPSSDAAGFCGWKVTTGAQTLDASFGEHTTKSLLAGDNTIYKAGDTIIVDKLANGDVVLEAVIHSHSWKYESNGNEIKAYCIGENGEDVCEHYGSEKAVTLTVKADSKTYDGTAASVSVENADTVTNLTGDAVTVAYYKTDAEGTITDQNSFADAPKNAGNYLATVTLGNARAEQKFTISPFEIKEENVTLDQDIFEWTGTEIAPVVTVKVSLNGAEQVLTPETDYTLSGTLAATDLSGTDGYIFTVSGTGNFTGNVEKTWKITKKVMTGISAAPVEATYDGASHGITVTGQPDGAEIIYSADGKTYGTEQPVCKDVKAGGYTVYYKVTKEGYEDYTGSATVTINPRPITVKVADKEITYGDAEPEYTSEITNGTLVKGDDLDLTYSREEGTSAKAYAITVTSKNSNYKLTAEPGTLTIKKKDLTITPKKAAKVYGNADPQFRYSVSGLVEGEKADDILTGALARTAGENKGTYAYEIGSLADASGNYNVNFNGTAAEFTITAKEAVLSWGKTDLTYNGAEQSVTAQVSNAAFDADTFTLEYTGNAATNAGNYKAEVTALGNDNYVLTENSNQKTDWSIEKADIQYQIPEAVSDLTYNGVDQAMITVTDPIGGTWMYKVGDGKWSDQLPTGLDAGTYTISYKVVGDDNHKDSTEGQLNVTIAKKAVVVSGITAEDKTYDGNTAAALHLDQVQFDGILGEDSLTVTASGVFEDKNAGKKKVQISNLVLDGASAKNYVLAVKGQQNETAATIHAKEITAVITPNGGIYEGTITPATAILKGLAGADDPKITLTYTGTGNDGTEADGTVPTHAGTYTVTASITDDNYSLKAEGASAEFVVAKADPALAVTAVADKNYGEEAFKLESTNKGDGQKSYTSSDEKVAKVDKNGLVTIVGAGTATLTVSIAESANYNAGEKNVTVTVKKIDHKLTVENMEYKVTYGDQTFKISASAGDKETSIKFASDNNDIASVSADGTVTVGNVGTAKITVSMDESPNYLTVAKEVTVTVVPKEVTVTPNDASKVYGEKDKEFSYTASGLVGDDTLSGITLTRTAGEDVGTYDITASEEKDANPNYSVRFNKRIFTITQKEIGLTWADTKLTYSGKDQQPSASATGLAGNDTCEVTVIGAMKNAGTYTATATQLSNQNYKLPAETTTEYTISAKEIGIEWSNLEFTYDGTKKQPTAKATGLVEGDTCSITVSGAAAKAGTHTAKAEAVDNANYKLPKNVETKFIINKAETAVSQTPEIIYDLTYTGKAQNLISDGKTEDGTFVYKVNDGEWSENIPSGLDAGTYEITYKVIGDDNHNDSKESKFTVIIAPKAVTVTPYSAEKHVGKNDPEKFTYQVAGLVGKDTLKGITVTRKEGEDPGKYDITASVDKNASNSNYKITLEKGTFTISGHDWSGEWKTVREATSWSEGKKEKTCAFDGCEQKKYEMIPKTGEKEDTNDKKLEKDAEVAPGSPIDQASLDSSKTELLEAPDIFTDDEQKDISAGKKNARVWIEVTPVNKETDLTPEEIAAIEKEAEKLTGKDSEIVYFNANLFKQVDGGEKTQIKDPGTKIKITIRIPEELLNHQSYTIRDYKIIRMHDGKAEVLSGTFNSSTKEFTFETDKFSTYAISYKDTYYAPSYPVTGVTVSPEKATLTKEGETVQLKETITPSYADNKNVTWTSSDEKVATVDKNGKVTAVSNGTAVITVTTADGKYTAKTTITVKIAPEKLTLKAEKTTLTKIGDSRQITAKVEPDNAYKKLIWKSSDEKVAIVDADGKVTAVGTGTATITATTEDGKLTESVTITVKIPDEPTVNETTGYGRLKARSVTQTNNSIKLEWTRVSGADGYIIYGNYCNGNGKTYKYNKITTITNGKTRTWTHIKLKKATYYKYIVKAYKVVNGKKVITDTSVSVHATTTGGKYGVAKAVSITKIGSKKNVTKATLKKGKTTQITATEIKKDKPIKHHRNICYESSNTKVATVTPDGVIQAKGKGTCTIWVYAQNGVYKTITVTVK